MASSTRKTALAIATVLTLIAVGGAEASHVKQKHTATPQATGTVMPSQPKGHAKPASGKSHMTVLDPLKKTSKQNEASKGIEVEVQIGGTEQKVENEKLANALKTVNSQDDTDRTEHVDKSYSPLGQVKVGREASQVEAELDQKELAESAQETNLAQLKQSEVLGNEDDDDDDDDDQDPEIEQIADEMAAYVGGRVKALLIIDKVITDLASQFTLDEIKNTLREEIETLKEKAAGQDPAQNQSPSVQNAEREYAKAKNEAQSAAIATSKAFQEREKVSQDFKEFYEQNEGDLVDFSDIAPELVGATIETTQEAHSHTSQELDVSAEDLNKAAEAQAEKKEADRKVQYSEALASENYIRIAKRSKAFLLAVNEQAKLEPRERFVDRALGTVETVIEKDLSDKVKPKFREPHTMGEDDIGLLLESLSEAIYQGVALKRTENYDLNNFFELYPPQRLHFDTDAMVVNPHYNDIVDELANLKAQSIAVRLVSERVAERLSTPQGETSPNASATKMFIEGAKGLFEIDSMTESIFDKFELAVTERPEAVVETLVDKCNSLLSWHEDLIIDQQAEVKSDFSLYSTFTFLNDDLTASIELISENIGLENSQLTARFTRTLVSNDLYDVKRPHDTGIFVLEAEDDPTQKIWYNLTANAF